MNAYEQVLYFTFGIDIRCLLARKGYLSMGIVSLENRAIVRLSQTIRFTGYWWSSFSKGFTF